MAENKNTNAAKFSKEMANLEKETLLKINHIAYLYAVDPFETIKLFGKHITDVCQQMQKNYQESINKSDGDESEV